MEMCTYVHMHTYVCISCSQINLFEPQAQLLRLRLFSVHQPCLVQFIFFARIFTSISFKSPRNEKFIDSPTSLYTFSDQTLRKKLYLVSLIFF